MNKLPFSVYDTFAYLASGLIVTIATDHAFPFGLNDSDLTIIGVLFGVVVLYILGHLVAHLSSAFFESLVVRRWLRSPEEHLLAEPTNRLAAKVFRAYFRPFPLFTRDQLKLRAKALGVPPGGRGFFYHCHGLAQRDPVSRVRLASFLNLYGFCRNASLALLLSAIALLVSVVVDPETALGAADSMPRSWLALAALAGSLGLFVRYLKFFRHYTMEVYLSCMIPSSPSC